MKHEDQVETHDVDPFARTRRAILSAAFLVAIAWSTVAAASQPRTAAVVIDSGPVRGMVQDRTRQFLGIPYAAPPIGELRWKPPQDVPRWTTTRDATSYGNVCAQNNKVFRDFGFLSEAEDCLFLNVITPLKAVGGKTKLPVMVWIPGGGLFIGGSTGYDASALVNTGSVIYVSMNYRLNVFGFMSHPAINQEGHAAGNYGIMDQQFALHWVKKNIGKFGGDPDNVTIFGESAGGVSVWAHLASPGSAGRFHKAIIESGTAAPNSANPSLKSSEEQGQSFASAAGCSDQSAQCLRGLSARQILEAIELPPKTYGKGRFDFGLMADGYTVPESMKDLFGSGRFNRVPLINGTNKDEFNWFLAMIEMNTGRVVSAQAYPAVLSSFFGAKAGEVLNQYPLDRYDSPSAALSAAVSDSGFICNGNRQANRVVSRFVESVYAYEFNVPDAPSSWAPVSFPYRSAHTSELQFLFPQFRGGSGTAHNLTPAQNVLARQMVRYWTNFARTGNPTPNTSDATLPNWPRYRADLDNYLTLRTPAPSVDTQFSKAHNCDFWDSQAPAAHGQKVESK